MGVWTPLGPDGGEGWAMAVDPANPDVVYLGTRDGVFKSTDGLHLDFGEYFPILGPPLQTILVDRMNPSTVYGGAGLTAASPGAQSRQGLERCRCST